MVRIDAQIRKQKRLAARARATAVRLDRHEDFIDLCQCFRIVKLQDPTLLRGAVFIKHA